MPGKCFTKFLKDTYSLHCFGHFFFNMVTKALAVILKYSTMFLPTDTDYWCII